jgi:methionyl-tRNA formyltransferase
MRVVLFGCGAKATAVLDKLLELKQDVVGVVYSELDKHENYNYTLPENVARDCDIAVLSSQFKDKVGWIRKLNPDVIFVVGWRYKIPREQYSIPPKGTIVFHDSLLPKYRGFAPMNWAIINGETETGATMFYIAEGVDSGDIIAQAEIPITLLDDAKTVETKVTKACVGLLETYLPLIKLDKVHRTPQYDRFATYTCKRVPSDGLIDWNKTTMQLYNFVRGLADPYPGAFTYLQDNKSPRKLFVWKADLDTEYNVYIGRVCGRVVDIIKGRGVRVLTGDGTLIIEEVSFENGNRVRADEIIKSITTTLVSLDNC